MRYLLVTLFFGGAVSAASISTSASCLIGNVGSAGGLQSCNITAASGAKSQAVSNASLTRGATSLSSSVQAYINGASNFAINNGIGIGNTADSESQFSISATLYTTGPARLGFVTVSSVDFWLLDQLGGANGNVAWSLGSINGGCSGAGLNSLCTGTGSYTLPFNLGTSFQFMETGTLAISPDPVVQLFGTGNASLNLQFQFFEADGVTPVQVFETASVPEPKSLALIALGLLGLLICRVQSV
jgi:PEP-CTERM motif